MSHDNESKKSVDEPLPNEFDRLLAQYDGKTKNFEKYFAILLGVSFFVLLFIFCPYVSNQILKQSYSEERKNVEKEINQLNNTLYPLREAITEMSHVKEEVINAPDDLRDYIVNISEVDASLVQGIVNNDYFDDTPQQAVQRPPEINPSYDYIECSHLMPSTNDSSNSKQWIECNIIQKVKNQLNGFTNQLNNSVVRPLYETSDSLLIKTMDFNLLNNELEGLNSTLFKEFEVNPSFWRFMKQRGYSLERLAIKSRTFGASMNKE